MRDDLDHTTAAAQNACTSPGAGRNHDPTPHSNKSTDILRSTGHIRCKAKLYGTHSQQLKILCTHSIAYVKVSKSYDFVAYVFVSVSGQKPTRTKAHRT